MVSKTTNTIFKEYIELHNKYTKLYGEKTIVLMQVGSFFEIYCRHNEKENLGPKPENLRSILNIIFSTKNKDTPNYHYMAGWPINSLDKLNHSDTGGEFTIKFDDHPTLFVRTHDNNAVFFDSKIMHNGLSTPFDSTSIRCVVAYKLYDPYFIHQQST